MDIFEIIVNILLLIASVLLVIVVLAQDSKSAGLGGAFGGETTALSTRGKKASREKQLQKLTVIFGIIVAVLALLMLLMPAFKKWTTLADDASAMLNVIRNFI